MGVQLLCAGDVSTQEIRVAAMFFSVFATRPSSPAPYAAPRCTCEHSSLLQAHGCVHDRSPDIVSDNTLRQRHGRAMQLTRCLIAASSVCCERPDVRVRLRICSQPVVFASEYTMDVSASLLALQIPKLE